MPVFSFATDWSFNSMSIDLTGPGQQIIRLLILGVPVACLSWTVTHEEVLRESRDWCVERSKKAPHLGTRKFFYLLTCECCFSHYVAAGFVALCSFQLLVPGFRGYVIGWLSLVWVANIYMSIFGRLRLEIKHERLEIAAE
ncbi:MAG: hypothetical protein WBW49_05275, partial [Candidatus Acidiferrum sp.]